MRGPAKEWFDHIESHILDDESFSTICFMEKYWNNVIQAKILRDLEFGFYRAEYNYSRSEYVLKIYNNVKMITGAPSEREIVEKIFRHFDEMVQQMVFARNICTINGLMNLLNSQDQLTALNYSLDSFVTMVFQVFEGSTIRNCQGIRVSKNR